jgi:dinuclear metal center YbgI/SA1388 family protein
LTVGDVATVLESWAPPSLQESYDNSGLLVGRLSDPISSVLVSLDCIEAVVDEAIAVGANMVVSHHPIVFKGLKRFNGSSYVERTVMKAIANGIALYAIHTNLDNVPDGVNMKLAELVGCMPQSMQVLRPKEDTLVQVVVYVPKENVDSVRNAMFSAGAGAIGDYDECGWTVPGKGSFRPLEGANPHIGTVGDRSSISEVKLEMVVETWKLAGALNAMKSAHPYEEVAHSVWPLQQFQSNVGSGMVGELPDPMPEEDFLEAIKVALGCGAIRHTKILGRTIRKVAVCGGSGSFLLQDALRAGADVFVTSDFKYHEFFDAENHILIADVGHYESEWQTTHLIVNRISKYFPNFAVHLASANPNPIHYR